MKKTRLTERFQQLAGIKPLYENEMGNSRNFRRANDLAKNKGFEIVPWPGGEQNIELEANQVTIWDAAADGYKYDDSIPYISVYLKNDESGNQLASEYKNNFDILDSNTLKQGSIISARIKV